MFALGKYSFEKYLRLPAFALVRLGKLNQSIKYNIIYQ